MGSLFSNFYLIIDSYDGCYAEMDRDNAESLRLKKVKEKGAEERCTFLFNICCSEI